MTFESILFANPIDQARVPHASEPDCFSDLALDQIIAAVTAGKEEYELTRYFYVPLHDADDIVFRQEVMQDLEQRQVFDHIRTFAEAVRAVRQNLARAERLFYQHEKEFWRLDAVTVYGAAVGRLADGLSAARLVSRGLSALRDHVRRYIASEDFTMLLRQARKLKEDLSEVRYNLLIKGTHVEVSHHEDEPDYSLEVDAIFEKFKQGAVEDYTFEASDSAELNHVEAAILDLVAKLHPVLFSDLETFVREHDDFFDSVIVRFDREVQFYVAYLEYLAPFRKAGLTFCYPRVTRASKEVYDYQGFDIALAGRLIAQNATPVCNDFHLEGPERVIVVSGPNQGGKTTFARTFGQLHYLASLGCPIPGTRAQTFLFDDLFTHFERQEDIRNLRGKLQDDLVRIHDILERASSRSLVILNEVFTSTTVRDASVLSRNIAARILHLDLLCIWVTFLDELASLSEKTVSMVSTVVPENPAQRTYKIVRRPADGLAYAMSIAEKHRLTKDKIRERLKS